MSTDRELLELAAKAAEYPIDIIGDEAVIFGLDAGPDGPREWNPLTDDGDALRLAVKLRLVVHVWDDEGAVSVAKTLDGGADPHVTDGDSWFAASGESQEENARRAIVQCAAKIGRAMP